VRDVAILVDGQRVAGWIEALDVLIGKNHGYSWHRIIPTACRTPAPPASQTLRRSSIGLPSFRA
jgi:hypothetical protein